jgi:hypothetical protein
MADGKPGREKVGGLAKIQGSIVKGKTAHGGPKFQGIAVGMADETVINLPGKMGGEGTA